MVGDDGFVICRISFGLGFEEVGVVVGWKVCCEILGRLCFYGMGIVWFFGSI